MGRPVIGVTAKTIARASENFTDATFWNSAISHNYCEGVLRAGGAPVLLPNVGGDSLANDFIEKIDGLLLSGGLDVNPLLFGEQPERDLGGIDPERDKLELALVKHALKKRIPIFGICRGIQALAVAAGGTLHQDVHRKTKTGMKHMQVAAGETATHAVEIEKSSRLYGILRKTKTLVNSYHHQAVSEVPKGFKIAAHAPDGIIEAVEFDGDYFALGVQWHPEMLLAADDSMRLFAAFVKAAGKNLS
jgi:putative glutamine amidotransferase